MLDDSLYARRASPLDRIEAAAFPAVAKIRVLDPETRFSLRLRHGGSQTEVAGFRLDQKVNAIVEANGRWSARLGPDEWLIGVSEGDGDVITQEIETALSGQAHSLVCVSHRNVGLEISGPRAAETLNAGCPLDLSDAAFPAGTATRTLLGKAEIVLIRAHSDETYRVDCWRSFATYVQGFLVEAAEAASAI